MNFIGKPVGNILFGAAIIGFGTSVFSIHVLLTELGEERNRRRELEEYLYPLKFELEADLIRRGLDCEMTVYRITALEEGLKYVGSRDVRLVLK
jgi:hypothetical protein